MDGVWIMHGYADSCAGQQPYKRKPQLYSIRRLADGLLALFSLVGKVIEQQPYFIELKMRRQGPLPFT